MNEISTDDYATDHFNSRRRAPRLEVMGQLHGRLVAMDVPLVVRDLGTGGFGIESAVVFPGGAVHTFRFTTPTRQQMVLRAAAVHCRPSARGGTYLTGFQFLPDPGGETDRAVEALLDAVTSVLMFQ